MAELADAPDLGSGTSGVQVRPLLPAPRRRKLCIACGDFFKSPARSLRCGSFFPRNFAGANFRGAPAALRTVYKPRSAQKLRSADQGFSFQILT